MSLRNDPLHPPSEDLFAYRDGELLPEKRAFIEAHVLGCSICRSFIDQVSSLESELRRTPDRVPLDYLDKLPASVRARIAGSAREEVAAVEAKAEETPAPRDSHDRAGAWRERERGRHRREGAGDDGRIKEMPRFPWAAVLSTASAAAAVLVVVVILIKQGIYQQVVQPKAPSVAMRTPGEEVPGDSAAILNGAKPDVGAAERGAGSLAQQKAKDLDAQESGRRDAKLEGKDRTRENLGLARKPDGLERAPAGAAPEGQTSEFREAPPASQDADKLQKKAANATPRSLASESNAPAGAYGALLARYGLPPVWDRAAVVPERLARAEQELRDLYVSGEAGADSARVRLYLAEAARQRYAPGDTTLYQEIERHYRRAIELAGGDAETARVAEERLRTLER